MCERLDQIYDEAFYRDRLRYRSTYHRFTQAVLEVFQPASVADVGCGMAWTVEYLRTRVPCIGIEGSRAALKLMKPEVRRLVHLHDLRDEPIPQMADYELCLSLEVAEHIEPSYVDHFLDWCTRGQALLLSAAPPGQRGLYHVNCRSQEWWGGKLGERHWLYSITMTAAWQEAARRRTKGCPWVVRNAMYFESPTRRSGAVAPCEGGRMPWASA